MNYVKDYELVKEIKKLLAKNEDYFKVFKELVSEKPLSRYRGDDLYELGVNVESYLHDPEITKNYNWKEIIKDSELYLPFYQADYGYSYIDIKYNFRGETIELLRVKSEISTNDFFQKTLYVNVTHFDVWRKDILLNKPEGEKYSKIFKELVSEKPLSLYQGETLYKLGADVESYLHDPEITKNYDWKEIIKDNQLYLPFFIYGNNNYGYYETEHNFKSDTIELLRVKGEISIEKFISFMDSPRPSIAAIIEWIFSKLSNKETLNSIMNNEEIDFFSLLAKGSYEQISLILDQIEQNEELLFTLRQIEFTVRYTSLKYNDDDNKIQPGIFERLNKLLLSNQDSSEPVAEITGTTLLDVMLMMTENNMKDIMSDEQIKNIQPSSINTKFFDFGNYKLIAYLKTNIEEFSTNLLNKLETDGASQTKIQLVKKILKFADEFNEGKLSDSELKIIENNQITLNKINPDTFKNSLNFDILFLALSTQNYRLAKELIEAGYKFYEDNEFGVNKISLITLGNIANEEKFLEIVKIAHEKEIFSLKQPISGTNDYPLDLIINNYLDPDSYFIDLAGGTLYKFKKPENVKIESINTDRISIAISHGNSFWSTGIFSATHFLQKQNPDIDFYLVTPQVIDQLGIDVFSTFDGWINPGAGDSYPKDKKEFSKADWKPEIDTEYIYQNVLGNATIYGLPTLGMCAGAQNLVLHHGGYIKPITGYSYGQHDITLQKNSPLSYLTLNHEEREEFHKIGHMPTIKFKGDTAHHFVAVNSKLPVGFSLGAVSEHNEAMGYCDASGIHCATQFHPENKANALNAQTNMMDRQIQLLNGFIELARMNHNCKNDNGICPTEFMANVNADLDLYYGICPLIGHEKALIEEMTC